MSVMDNQRLMIKVCELYYNGNNSQKVISAKLGISRSQISRILANARENGTVSIKINNPNSDETNFENALIEKYGLDDALVFDTGGLSGYEATIELSKMASTQIDVYIPNQGLVGIMSGKTISELVKFTNGLDRRGMEFVPLIGGLGSGGTDWHANIIAKTFADKTYSKYYVLNAPVLVKNVESKNILVCEPEIINVLEKGKKCDVAIIGVGQISEVSTAVVAGALTLSEVEMLKKAGAVASVCGSYLDEKGNEIENDITNRTIGQTLKTIRKSKKIAIAAGQSKEKALKATLLGGHIDVLITNLATAKEIV